MNRAANLLIVSPSPSLQVGLLDSLLLFRKKIFREAASSQNRSSLSADLSELKRIYRRFTSTITTITKTNPPTPIKIHSNGKTEDEGT